jgi:hypothetical protein
LSLPDELRGSRLWTTPAREKFSVVGKLGLPSGEQARRGGSE